LSEHLRQWIGYRIKRDAFNQRGVVLLPANTIFEPYHIELIENHGIYLDANDFELDTAEIKEPKKTNENLVAQASEEIKEIFHFIYEKKSVPIEEVDKTIIPAICQATEYPSLFSVLSGLQDKDDYTYRHNIGVGVISTMIGKWLNFNEEELSLLSMAATLHDIGKINIEVDILNKSGDYTDSEYALMKKHTLFGYEILSKTPGLSPRIPLVALQHHEREDGSGYPYGIKGDQIDYYSKIVAIADIFHAMTSKRKYKDASPLYQVIKQLQEDSFSKLDPRICNLFIRRLMELAIGDEAILTDGRRCRIISVNPVDVANPIVEVGGEFLDLSKEPDLFIHALVG
jgi:HD-GYP domain-containing protein (c-di-GMP phosphodiesterase class II)